MTGKDIIKKLMEEENVTNVVLAERIGVTQATMWARLNNTNAKDLPLAVFGEMLSALGYEMVVRRKDDDGGDRNAQVVVLDEATKPEGRGRPKTADRMKEEAPRVEKKRKVSKK